MLTSGGGMECIVYFGRSSTGASGSCEGRSHVVHIFIARDVFHGGCPSAKSKQNYKLDV